MNDTRTRQCPTEKWYLDWTDRIREQASSGVTPTRRTRRHPRANVRNDSISQFGLLARCDFPARRTGRVQSEFQTSIECIFAASSILQIRTENGLESGAKLSRRVKTMIRSIIYLSEVKVNSDVMVSRARDMPATRNGHCRFDFAGRIIFNDTCSSSRTRDLCGGQCVDLDREVWLLLTSTYSVENQSHSLSLTSIFSFTLCLLIVYLDLFFSFHGLRSTNDVLNTFEQTNRVRFGISSVLRCSFKASISSQRKRRILHGYID